MSRLLLVLFAACSAPPPPASPSPAPSLVTLSSASDHGATLDKLVASVEARGFVVVHRIDHAAAAKVSSSRRRPSWCSAIPKAARR